MWGCLLIEYGHMNVVYGGSLRTALWNYNIQALRREIIIKTEAW
jgi:hypothetical protein